MSDDNRDDIPGPDAVTTPEANVTQAAAAATDAAGKETPPDKLSQLMSGAAETARKPAVDLESQAIRAAEQALAEGEKALQEARAQLAREKVQTKQDAAGAKRRELALRLLLAGNVLAMVVVALLPSRPETPAPLPTTPPNTTAHEQPVSPTRPQVDGPFERAVLAASRHEWATAIEVLERHLLQSPGVMPSERLSILMSLSHWCAKVNDFKKSAMYRSQMQALEESHSLPDDLVKSAEAALKSGDQESLRRLWARFLLQQRQIPSWLYQHVAEAYLQLGDSYRHDADAADEKVRLAELEVAAEKLRADAQKSGEQKGGAKR